MTSLAAPEPETTPAPARPPAAQPRPPEPEPDLDLTPSIAVIGAGFGGLCAALKLKQAGFNKLTIYEKAERVGGTWNYNTYPGCACDVRVQLYSYSFEQNANWSYVYAHNDEIQAYTEMITDKYKLRDHLKLNSEVKSAVWDSSKAKWKLTFAAGDPVEVDILIGSLGQLNVPCQPDIPGQESFAGQSFHSARWRHDVDLATKKVGVIGNAASAVQFIPEIAKQAGHLTVFQRSANWLLPRNDKPFTDTDKNLFKFAPWLMKMGRNQIYWWAEWMFWGAFDPNDWRSRFFTTVSLGFLEKSVSDPHLREKLTPKYPIGCKRIIFSDDYYPTLNEPHVSLITDAIEAITPEGVKTKDGKVHELDVLIYGTGFETSNFNWSMDVVGKAGVRLKEAWKDGPEAYLGLTVAGFPNFFMTYGPNTNLGHNSIIFMIEQQVNYIVQCVEKMNEENVGVFEIRRAVQDDFNKELQAALAKTSWAGDCGSWYKNKDGRITNNWMGTTQDYKRRTHRPLFDDYEMRPRVDYSLNQLPVHPPTPAPDREPSPAS